MKECVFFFPVKLSLVFAMQLCCEYWPTDEPKDIPNSGDEDDEHADPNQQNHCNGNVADPAEIFWGT